MLQREHECDVDAHACADQAFDGNQSGSSRRHLDQQVGAIDGCLQAQSGGHGAVRVVGQGGRYLEADIARATLAVVEHRAQQVASALYVRNDQMLIPRLGRHRLGLEGGKVVLVIPSVGNRLVEDRRVGGDSGNPVFGDEACELSFVEQRTGEVV
ncbi:hypothetical protein SDC9_177470 [bioreactor metagenome]|uniref:Uncharacterized protein n=1 Tax=bioreactor metagenome TaxID=1076179 RepID=A0A645H2E3_9ZZZZ